MAVWVYTKRKKKALKITGIWTCQLSD